MRNKMSQCFFQNKNEQGSQDCGENIQIALSLKNGFRYVGLGAYIAYYRQFSVKSSLK